MKDPQQIPGFGEGGEAESMRQRATGHSSSTVDAIRAARVALENVHRRAEATWTTAETLTELDGYLSAIDRFSPHPDAAQQAWERLGWLRTVLAAGAAREGIAEPSTLGGTYAVLDDHRGLIAAARDVSAPEVVTARRLAQLEIKFLLDGT